jgi:hypothetical protein
MTANSTDRRFLTVSGKNGINRADLTGRQRANAWSENLASPVHTVSSKRGGSHDAAKPLAAKPLAAKLLGPWPQAGGPGGK